MCMYVYIYICIIDPIMAEQNARSDWKLILHSSETEDEPVVAGVDLPNYPLARLAMPCHAMACRAMPCHAMQCRTMPCHAMVCSSLRKFQWCDASGSRDLTQNP